MIVVQEISSKQKGYLEIDNSVNKIMVKNDNKDTVAEYYSIAELYRYWEDYEKPKMLYWINYDGSISSAEEGTMSFKNQKVIGNYFESYEEAEKAVEKLKAWKRLKDFGCRFILDDHSAVKFVAPDVTKITTANEQSMLTDAYKLLFGGEDE